MAFEPMSFAVGFNAEVGGIQNSLFRLERKMNNTMEALSTGKRVNEMQDDEGGMAIADVMKGWKSGAEEAIYNLKEFSTALKITQKALDDIQAILLEMRSTIDRVQGIDDPNARAEAASTVHSLAIGINRIIAHTEYKGQRLFNVQEAEYINQTNNAGAEVRYADRFIRFGAGSEDVLSWDLGINPRAEKLGQVLRAEIHLASGTMGFAPPTAGGVFINGRSLYEIAKENGIDPDTPSTGLSIRQIVETVKRAFNQDVKVDVVTSGDGGVNIVVQAAGDFTYTDSAGNVQMVRAVKTSIHEETLTSTAAAGVNVGYTGLIKDQRTNATFYPNETDYDTITTGNGEDNSWTVNNGLFDIRIDSNEDAAMAKVMINAAIIQLDEVRNAISGMQHMVDSLIDQRMEEVVQAEAQISHITDTDYAKELAEFTKQQIAQQAGVNMLAQKRQMAQLVTQLLR